MGIHEHLFDVEAAKRRLQEGTGGYEIVHESPGLEVGVYVLVAPETPRPRRAADRGPMSSAVATRRRRRSPG